MRRIAGSTLAELLVSMGIFGTLLTAVFILFAIGSRGFYRVESQQGVQNQLAAIRASLSTDLELTHYYGIGVRENQTVIDGTSQHRDAFSAVALSDWSNFNSSSDYKMDEGFGMPKWDRWVLYRIASESEGTLVRHILKPSDTLPGRAMLKDADRLTTLADKDEVYSASWGGGIENTQVLARSVRSMQVELDLVPRTINITISLVQKADKNNPKSNLVKASFLVQPKNSVPTD